MKLRELELHFIYNGVNFTLQIAYTARCAQWAVGVRLSFHVSYTEPVTADSPAVLHS